MLATLTARQKETYDFLLRVIREKGYVPSIPEIEARFKLAAIHVEL
jgi:SOS-response transcriptional repressor LexA